MSDTHNGEIGYIKGQLVGIHKTLETMRDNQQKLFEQNDDMKQVFASLKCEDHGRRIQENREKIDAKEQKRWYKKTEIQIGVIVGIILGLCNAVVFIIPKVIRFFIEQGLMIAGIIAFVWLFAGCSLFGGTASNADSEAEMETEIVTRLAEHEKRIESIEKNITATAGKDLNIQDIRQEIRETKKMVTNVEEKTIKSVQNQVTKQSNSTGYVVAVLGLVLGFSLLKDLIRSWRESGSTLKNFIGLIT